MDDNKNLELENDVQADNSTDTVKEETVDEAVKDNDNKPEVKASKKKKEKKPKEKKPKKIRNQAFLKRGGFSLAITAAVLAGIIVLNVLVLALSKRFNLEFDMSTEKNNSISAENVDYIKKLDTKVNVTICADEDSYVGGYMQYYAQNLHSVNGDATDYYKQTVKLLHKYADYNNKITVDFVDTQDTAFTQISSKYANDKLAYGDIIVSATVNGNERYKIITFEDVYALTSDDTYASYGYSTNTVSGNNIETALTSAISYVTSSKTKKVALLTGHSSNDYTASYKELLKTNNYDIDVISDTLITKISNDYDAVILSAPTTDFMGSELDVISDFLDNNNKYNKGLIFFADASAPYLTNLYDFLNQWGIQIDEGILFETDSSNHMPDEPSTIGSYPGDDKITSGMKLFITGLNVPMTQAFDSKNLITVTNISTTPESCVAAPVGVSNDWTGADNYTKKAYATALQSVKADYDDDNKLNSSYVMAFSSIEFIQSQYLEQSSVGNKNLTLAAAERAVGAENTGISFVSKKITNESFSDSVTESSTQVIRIIFMALLPILSIAAGIYIFIRRKNS